MILKSYEINNLNLKNNFFLIYGKNEGLKKEIIKKIFDNNKEVFQYEEKEILENTSSFIESILTNSLFEDDKKIIIKRVTDKIFKIIEELSTRNVDRLSLILDTDILEKRSKLRSFFEKNKKYICIAVYPDTPQTLQKLAIKFFKDKNISISQSNINLIINKSNGDREKLLKDVQKIEFYTKNGKKITNENLIKLINLTEDYNVSELIDNCLAKNEKKTLTILNENNFSNEDCILITRIFLNKSKKILKLCQEFEKNNNIDLTISSAKPAIFWKDKEITKQQIYKWKPKTIKNLIYKINEIELIIKKNLNNSVNLITDFLLEQSSKDTNN